MQTLYEGGQPAYVAFSIQDPYFINKMINIIYKNFYFIFSSKNFILFVKKTIFIIIIYIYNAFFFNLMLIKIVNLLIQVTTKAEK